MISAKRAGRPDMTSIMTLGEAEWFRNLDVGRDEVLAALLGPLKGNGRWVHGRHVIRSCRSSEAGRECHVQSTLRRDARRTLRPTAGL